MAKSIQPPRLFAVDPVAYPAINPTRVELEELLSGICHSILPRLVAIDPAVLVASCSTPIPSLNNDPWPFIVR